MSEVDEHIQHLRSAELQFRLASAVRLASTFKAQPLDLPLDWSHGRHSVHYSEIALSEEDADYGAWNLHRSATFLMAVAMKDAIRVAVSDPKNHSDSDVCSAYQISRLVRNAFAHAPFDPVWSIDIDCRDRVFSVRDIIALDATGIQGQHFNWRHYGGPLALLRLSQYVRTIILNDSEPPSPVIPMPKNVYVQQSDLILKRVDEIPAGATPVDIERLPDGGIPLGNGHVIYPIGKTNDGEAGS